MAPQLGFDTTGIELVAEYADHIRGTTILVTGVSPGGLGAIFAEKTAAGAPALLVLAGRNGGKAEQTVDAISSAYPNVKAKALEIDLASLMGVIVPNIDVLAEDGFEMQFGTNHLGPFSLTNLFIGKIMAAAAPRIVMVSGDGHRLGHIRWTDSNFNDGKHYSDWHAYGQSKTANCLTALSLAEKLGNKGLLSFSLPPGVVYTNLAGHLDSFDSLRAQDISMGTKFMWPGYNPKTEDQGIATHVFTAFNPNLSGGFSVRHSLLLRTIANGHVQFNGRFFNDCRVVDQNNEENYPCANNKSDADRLWRLSEKLVGEDFSL
ncbi:short-chain dehydrogenase/ reductase [Colletotrichum caudatum]|nr:short-chain dehydrogenase/ reductase [Colletotrichum caudatum]